MGDLVTPELLRAYISLARRQEPFVPDDLGDYVVAHYCALRQKERDDMDGRSYVTPRTLLSILRLAQAVAKLRFDEEVSRSDVDAALALMTASQASITPDIERRVRDDPISRVYQAVRTHALRTRTPEVALDTIRQLVAFDSEINKVRGGGRGCVLGGAAGGPAGGLLGACWGALGAGSLLCITCAQLPPAMAPQHLCC